MKDFTMKEDLYEHGESGIVPFSARSKNGGVGSTFYFFSEFFPPF